MQFQELQRIIGDHSTFRTGFLLAGQRSPSDVRRQLSRWVNAGKVIRLRRGLYVLAEPYAKKSPHPFVLANEMRRASYVSMQSALAWYGCIPEYVPAVTSVTAQRPEKIENAKGHFIFRHIKHELLWGMNRVEVSPSQLALVASPEKALIDLIYLTPHSDSEDYLEELRLVPDDRLSSKRFLDLAARTNSKKVMRAANYLIPTWDREGSGKSRMKKYKEGNG